MNIVSIVDVQYLLKDGGSDENVDFLVKGHSTTKNENAGNTPTGFIPIEEGNVHVLAAEILPSGGKVIVIWFHILLRF